MSTTLSKPYFVWLGAGETVDSQLQDQFLQQHPEGLVALLEGRENAVVKLKQRYADSKNCTVNGAVIDVETGKSTFYTLNLPEFSSLQQPTGLVSLFPGVAVQKIELVDTLAVDQYIAGLNIETEQPNQLYIDIPAQAGSILRQLATHEQLHFFSELHLTVSPEALYEQGEKLGDIEDFLSKQGYEVISTDNTDPDILLISFKLSSLWQRLDVVQKRLSKALEHNVKLTELHKTEKKEWVAKVDELNRYLEDKTKEQAYQSDQVVDLQQQLDSKAKQVVEQTQKIEVEQSARVELEVRLEQAEAIKAKTEKNFMALRKQTADLQQQLDIKAKQIVEQSEKLEVEQAAKAELQAILKNIKEAATKQLDEIKREADQSIKEHAVALAEAQSKVETTLKQLAEMAQALNAANAKVEVQTTLAPLEQVFEEKLQQMFTAQSEEINKAVGNIKSHVTAGLGNTAKQLESFHGIQNYIERGVKPLSFHGWPISPDIGLYITGLIDANNYDVIIEFGSGTSTVLMAKALQAKQRNIPVRTVIEKAESKQNQVVVSDTDYKDLPARIITFEHNSIYHTKTQRALEANDVDYLVDLVHTPLVDYQHKDGTQYLYYSCNDKLNELAKVLKGRKANIFVLVDGPPGATNKNARFPALDFLMGSLIDHSITIVMDDFNRNDEKEIIDKWIAITKEYFIYTNSEIIRNEKGAAIIYINQ